MQNGRIYLIDEIELILQSSLHVRAIKTASDDYREAATEIVEALYNKIYFLAFMRAMYEGIHEHTLKLFSNKNDAEIYLSELRLQHAESVFNFDIIEILITNT